MDIKREVYPSGNSWFGKITTTSSPVEMIWYSEYAEPTIDVGGAIVDGTVSFNLTSVTKRVSLDSPFGQEFNPTTLNISLSDASKRAQAFVNVLTTRIETAMDNLKAIDGTSVQAVTYRVV